MKYEKKSRWIQIVSVMVVGIVAFCLAFSGMTFANDGDRFQADMEKAGVIRRQSKWFQFPQQLKAAQLLPDYLVALCNEPINSAYVDSFGWEDDGHGMGLGIRIQLRGEALLHYEYANGGKTKVVEELHPIDNGTALQKVVTFLKTFQIGTPELQEKLSDGTDIQSKITIQPVETKNPNYHLIQITMVFGEQDRYDFTVDMNMGGIIAFDNLYEKQLAERDVILWYHTILNGKDYVDQVQPGQVYLWTSKTGRVWDLNFENNFSVTEHFDNKETLLAVLKKANHEKDFPIQLDFQKASVDYYLTPDNVDYAHPIKNIKVEDDVYFKVFDLKDDYTKNIKRIFVYYEDNKDHVGYGYSLTNDDMNWYSWEYDPEFRLVPVKQNPKPEAGGSEEVATASSSAVDPDYQPPVVTVTHLEHPSFDGAALKETTEENGTAYYSIGAIRRIPPIQCYDFFSESVHPETKTFTGVEVFYFADDVAGKDKMLTWFQQNK